MIRRDVFSVKVLNDGRWCHTFMTRDKRRAVNVLAAERASVFTQDAKLVHPADWVVVGYVAHNGPLDSRS